MKKNGIMKVNPFNSRETISLQKYFQEIKKFEGLSREEEVRLAPLIRQGDEKALEKLVNANLKFAAKVALNYQHRGFSVPDLINEANFGLIEAAKKFDETRGYKFITYAVWTISSAILVEIAKHGRSIRLSDEKYRLQKKIINSQEKLFQLLQREPTDFEIAEHLNMPIEEIDITMIASRKVQSFDEPVVFNDESSGDKYDKFDSAEEPEVYKRNNSKSLSIDLERVMSRLTNEQRQIVKWKFGIGIDEPLSFKEIAKIKGCSDSNIQVIFQKGFKQLKNHYPRELLREHI